MAEYRRAVPQEEADILDFINMVFSQAHRPHDFARLLPKVYARKGFSRYHYVAVEEGRIRGTVAVLPLELQLEQGCALKVGYIGSVSTHPRDRGAGHMKALMHLAMREAELQGYDLLSLGGRRQRYGYFGFENGGMSLAFSLNRDNIRHAMAEVDESQVQFRRIVSEEDTALAEMHRLSSHQPMTCVRRRDLYLDTMRSWNGQCYAIEDLHGARRVTGVLYAQGDDIHELTLSDERCLEAVLKAWMKDRERARISVPAHQYARAGAIKRFAENYQLSDAMMLHVFNWRHTLEKLLSFKAGWQTLEAGRLVFEVEGAGRYEICVREHEVTVNDTDRAPEMRFSPQEAVAFFFSPFTAVYSPSALLKSWLPVPLDIPAADAF